ncbi:DUF3987 domain-containing protein [Tautonia plasticadhaerens]|uniref:DUF3987 domain-containing protein n=1 Tax=Tautonia plasticadhaerens TaxID=2527974 RepID=A0A518GZU9_9BACT|nr:DUF3987 domain-containing protein [Tautonia plasticadhaerens]QDV34106.1 hypothetical protein ElP_19880 [Tautonia plasticadhaerens]
MHRDCTAEASEPSTDGSGSSPFDAETLRHALWALDAAEGALGPEAVAKLDPGPAWTEALMTAASGGLDGLASWGKANKSNTRLRPILDAIDWTNQNRPEARRIVDVADGREWPVNPLGRDIPDPVPFPVEAFPDPVRLLIDETAGAFQVPPDFPGLVVICAAAAAIGQSVNLRLKRTWTEPPTLYGAAVGSPGDGKTHAAKFLVGPLRKIDDRLRRQYDRDLEAWEAEDSDERGPRPVRRRVMLRPDATRESVIAVHNDNPRGLLRHVDELTGWLYSMNEYRSGSGGDRPFWLSNWSGADAGAERKTNREVLDVSRPSVVVLGGLVPSKLPSLREKPGQNDGLTDRFLYAYPGIAVRRRWTEDTVSVEAEDSWAAALTALWHRPMEQGKEGPRPVVVDFSRDGKARWVEWYDAHQSERETPEFPEDLRGAWPKFETICARLALVLAQLRQAYGKVDAARPGGWSMEVGSSTEDEPPVRLPSPASVEAEDVEGAAALVDYFKVMARRVLGEIHEGRVEVPPDAHAILAWIRRKSLDHFSANDVNRDSLSRFRGRLDRRDAALGWLERQGCIRVRPEEDREGKSGRPPSPSYEVNPNLNAVPPRNPPNPLNP